MSASISYCILIWMKEDKRTKKGGREGWQNWCQNFVKKSILNLTSQAPDIIVNRKWNYYFFSLDYTSHVTRTPATAHK